MNYLYFLLLLSTSCYAAAPLTTQIGIGYRQDSLNWNIGSPTGQPNVLSELSWKQLRMVDYRTEMIYNRPGTFYVRAIGDYARIYSGTVRDSDWHGDNRTREFSRSISDAGKGEAFDLSACAGYKRYCIAKGITAIPVVGYSWHEQHLRMFNGVIVLNTESSFLGPFDGLHANYRGKWFGPLFGCDFYSAPCSEWQLYANVQGQYNFYRGSGHWNLRDDILDDFTHSATGWGFLLRFGVSHEINPCLWAGIEGEYQNHWTEAGWDRIKALHESEEIVVRQPLNRVRWQSGRILGTLAYHW